MPIEKQTMKRLKQIHGLSRRYNRCGRLNHEQQLLGMMKEHVEEIETLCRQGDRHFLVETGDLVILCLELMLENRRDVHKTLRKCLGRFEKKLTLLLKRK